MSVNNATVHNLQLIFDDEGNITIQCDEYVNHYTDAEDAWNDFEGLLEGEDPIEDAWWESAGASRISPTETEITDGKYIVYTADEVADILESEEVDSLGRDSVAAFFSAAGCEID